MPSVWEYVRARKQIRWRAGQWELSALVGRSWVVITRSHNWTRLVWMATDEQTYRPKDHHLVPQVVWLSQ